MAVLLLWILHVFVLSCVCYVFVRVCLYVLWGHLLGKGWPLGSRLWCLLWVCHCPIGILGQVWNLIVSIPDLCTLTYFDLGKKCRTSLRLSFLEDGFHLGKQCWTSLCIWPRQIVHSLIIMYILYGHVPVSILYLFPTVPWFDLWYVIVEFPNHTHLLFFSIQDRFNLGK